MAHLPENMRPAKEHLALLERSAPGVMCWTAVVRHHGGDVDGDAKQEANNIRRALKQLGVCRLTQTIE